MIENTTMQFVNIVDLSYKQRDNCERYSGGRFLEELVVKLSCEYDYYDNAFTLDVTEPNPDELGHFLDNCQGVIFIIGNLSYEYMDPDSMKSMIDLILFYKHKTVLILADYGKKDYPNHFNIEKEYDSFELQSICKNFYAISDIWLKKNLNVSENEPSNIDNRYIYSNKEIIDIASKIINYYLTESEDKIPLMLQEKVFP